MAAPRQHEQGFALVEILIIILILAVLLIVVVPNVSGLFRSAKLESFNADKAQIQTAVEAYHLTRPPNVYPTSGGGAGLIDFSLLITQAVLLRTVPQSAGPAHGGTGSYTWYIDGTGTITTTFIDSTYP